MVNINLKLILVCLFILNFIVLNAQKSDLYIPKDIKRAYKAKTRSFDGKPGENYWQNRADYEIHVELVPETRKVIATENINYYNNSPDTLHRILFHVYQDFFKKGNLRDFPISGEDVHDGVIIKEVYAGNSKIEQEHGFNTRRSILTISLPEPLPPKSNLHMKVSWEFIMPHVSNIRYGSYDESSFFVAYWFPAIAVYDDIDGWNAMGFSGMQEFYNNFGDFNVEITVPNNFIVWATGVLQNPDELLQKKYLDLFNSAKQSDEIINIITKDDLSKKITSGKNKKTWKYKAAYVCDFAFATSDHYLWDATSIVVDKNTNRRVFIQTGYNQDSEDFYDVAQISRKAISFFSFELPGIAFPFPELTVFNGGGGMEFPMMVNDGSSQQRSGTVHVTSHEILHSYLPFYMGTNEQKYAWMDEGWAVMLPLDFQEREAEGYHPKEQLARSFSHYSGNEQEVPPMILSSALSGKTYWGTYRIASYTRPALAYEFLKDMLGKEKFNEVMNEYVKRWNGKHPIPYDFFFTFDDYLNEDLSWYWKPWFFDPGYPEISIGNVNFSDNECSVEIIKEGNLPVPIRLKYIFDDNKEDYEYRKVSIWKEGKDKVIINKRFNKKLVKIELDTKEIPDIDKSNNSKEF